MRNLALSAAARRDIEGILAYSRQRFGDAGADRYQALIFSAFTDLRNDPARLGVRDDRLQPGISLYHLRSASRPERSVRTPRHWIAFTIKDGQIRVIRVLHESMNLLSHLR